MQPQPIKNDFPAVWDLVLKDFETPFQNNTNESAVYVKSLEMLFAVASNLMKNGDIEVVQAKVVEDMKARNEFGIQKYGMALQPFNGRQAIQDAYEEVLDLVAYLRQHKFEHDYREGATVQ